MNEYFFVNAFSEIQININNKELSQNEKIFLFSTGFSLHTFITSNRVNYDRYYGGEYKLIDSYYHNNIDYLIKIYNTLGEKISISKILSDIFNKKIEEFDYVRDSIKMFYLDYLNENEKSHVIELLNEVPKKFLIDSRSIDSLTTNINNLSDFFEIMYYITDKRFRYNKKAVYDLLNTNKYIRQKIFFDTLRDIIIQRNNHHFYYRNDDEITLAFIDNIKTLLLIISENFNMSMAKSLLK